VRYQIFYITLHIAYISIAIGLIAESFITSVQARFSNKNC